jgi:hypothetical protein
MARFDRCRVCDYTEAMGSGNIGVSPGGHGKVRRFAEDFLCDACSQAIDQAAYQLVKTEGVDEALEDLDE